MKKLFTTLLFLCPYILFAQTNLTGKWTRTTVTSIEGPSYTNATSTAIEITSKGDQLTIAHTSEGPSGETTITETVSTNGKVSKSTRTDGGFRLSTITKKDDGSLKEHSTITAAGDENNKLFEITEEWKLQGDGTLLITRRFQSDTNPDDHWAVSAVYQKQ